VERRRQRRGFYRVKSKLNLLTRNNERLSLTFRDSTDRRYGQVVIVNRENIHSASAAHAENEEVRSNPFQTAISIDEFDFDGPNPSSIEDPIKYLLQCHDAIAAVWSPAARRSTTPALPFAEHVHMVRRLLLNYEATKTTEARQSTQDRLRSYIVASSHRKVYRRLRLGQSQHGNDFYEMMTINENHAVFEADDVPDLELLRRVPTSQQLQQYEWFISEAGDEASSCMGSRVNLPVYDKEGRKLLHAILSSYLGDTASRLRELQRLSKFGGLEKNAQRLGEIRPLVNQIRLGLQCFVHFLRSFKPVLLEHLKWLGRQRRDDVKAFDKTSTKSAEATEQDSRGAAAASNEEEALSQPSDLSSRPSSLDDSHDSENESDDFDQDILTDMQNLQLEEKKSGWAEGAMSYLHLICSHEESIQMEISTNRGGFTAIQRRERRLFAESKFTVIDIHHDPRNDTRKSFNECLDEICQRNQSFEKDEIVQRLDWERINGLRRHDSQIFSSTRFTGSITPRAYCSY
jgi:hypothetical protein